MHVLPPVAAVDCVAALKSPGPCITPWRCLPVLGFRSWQHELWHLLCHAHKSACSPAGPSFSACCICQHAQGECSCLRQVLVPPLRELENYIFNQMFNFLWGIMTDFAASDAAGVPVGRPPLHPPSREETAIWRWLEAMQVGPACDKQLIVQQPCGVVPDVQLNVGDSFLWGHACWANPALDASMSQQTFSL